MSAAVFAAILVIPLAQAASAAEAPGSVLPTFFLLVVSVILHAIVSVAVGYTLHRVRSRDRQIDDWLTMHGRRIDSVETGLANQAQASLLHDKKLEVLMNREFVPRDECRGFRGEIRDTSTRIFSKIEELQKAEAATRATTEAACRQILERLDRLEESR